MKHRPRHENTLPLDGDKFSIPLQSSIRRTLERAFRQKGRQLDLSNWASLVEGLESLSGTQIRDLLFETNFLLHLTEETAQRFIKSSKDTHEALEEIHRKNETVLDELDDIVDAPENGSQLSRQHLVLEVRALVEALSTRNTELEIARRTADEAAAVRARFLANISHEVRTPLNGILGMTQLVLDSSLEPLQREHLETVVNSGQTLLHLLTDLLDYSKLGGRQLGLSRDRVDPRALLEDLFTTTRATAEKAGLEFRATFTPSLPPRIHADAGRLRQVLTNLLDNAVKFTSEGWISVNTLVAPATTDDGRRILVVEIDDTGPGIEQDRLPEIFRPFVQGDVSTTRVAGGAGLGLSIVLELTQLMGGDIEVASKQGEGSRFVLRLPFDEVFEMTPGPATRLRPRPKTTPGNPPNGAPTSKGINGTTVLVVEDNLVNQRVALLALKRLGYQCAVANNGIEAVEAASGQLFPVILMDIAMPRMDGIEAAGLIRAPDSASRNAQIVAMTGHAFDHEREKCFEAGMDGFIAKPFDLIHFEQVVGEAFQAYSAAVSSDQTDR